MRTSISKARVTTPDVDIQKAVATIELDEETGGATLTVVDRRSLAVLLEWTGSVVQIDRSTYQFTAAESSDVATVMSSTGCGCGGTTVTRLTADA